MLNRLPAEPASFADILQDLGIRPAQYPKLAKRLGVTERTIFRWKATDAPKCARLALWWITNPGLSTWDAEAFNQVQMHRGMNASLVRENRRLVALLRQLGQVGDYGSANDPAPEVPVSARKERQPPLEAGPGGRDAPGGHVTKGPGAQREDRETGRQDRHDGRVADGLALGR